MPGKPRIALIGAGDRGSRYARLITETGIGTISAVAEEIPERLNDVAERAGVGTAGRYPDWRDLLAGPRVADAVVVATRDHEHYSPTVAALAAGYHVLVEKPMAVAPAEAIAMVEAAERAGLILAVCHVLRYTEYTRAIRRLLDDGLLGDVVSIEHLEPVGWWHFAHSYVRGNWRRQDESTTMLMAKSVHDIDWLSHIVGRPARKVSSFGSLSHFRPEHRPLGAADRCLDCSVEPSCPYSAPRLYLSCLSSPDDVVDATEQKNVWPLSVVTAERTIEGVLQALRVGPYGRCVYDCDNDVVDHQVVNIEYEGGVTASFSVNAFTPHTFRKTRIFGSHGYLSGNGAVISTKDFRSALSSRLELSDLGGPSAADGHGGGDEGLVRAFTAAVGDGPNALTPARESLASHQLTWAIERARLTSTVIDLSA